MGAGQYQKGGKRITQPVLRVDPGKVNPSMPSEEKPPYYKEVMDYLGRLPEGSNPGMFISRTQGWVLGAFLALLATGLVFATIVVFTRAAQQENSFRRLHEVEIKIDKIHQANQRMERQLVEHDIALENLRDQ
jgi:hypothetical protein